MMKPTLVINPATDAVFASFAEMLVEHGALSEAELQRRLRIEYPAALVRARQLSGEPRTVWYVYRDGRWVQGGFVHEIGGSDRHAGPEQYRRPACDIRVDPPRRGGGRGAGG